MKAKKHEAKRNNAKKREKFDFEPKKPVLRPKIPPKPIKQPNFTKTIVPNKEHHMAHSEKTDDTTHASAPPAVDEVKEALQRLIAVVDKYGEGPNQELRDAFDFARQVLAKAAAKEAASKEATKAK